jgi:hypothetical protein
VLSIAITPLTRKRISVLHAMTFRLIPEFTKMGVLSLDASEAAKNGLYSGNNQQME